MIDLNKIIEDAVRKTAEGITDSKITTKDATEIVNELMPVIDELISKRVKEHLAEIASYIFQKINKP